jgi:hypothetical protein
MNLSIHPARAIARRLPVWADEMLLTQGSRLPSLAHPSDRVTTGRTAYHLRTLGSAISMLMLSGVPADSPRSKLDAKPADTFSCL